MIKSAKQRGGLTIIILNVREGCLFAIASIFNLQQNSSFIRCLVSPCFESLLNRNSNLTKSLEQRTVKSNNQEIQKQAALVPHTRTMMLNKPGAVARLRKQG